MQHADHISRTIYSHLQYHQALYTYPAVPNPPPCVSLWAAPAACGQRPAAARCQTSSPGSATAGSCPAVTPGTGNRQESHTSVVEKVLGVSINHTTASNSVVIIMEKVLGVSVSNSVVIIMEKVLGVSVSNSVVIIMEKVLGVNVSNSVVIIMEKVLGVSVNHTTASNSVVIWKRWWGLTSITLLPLILLSYGKGVGG